MPNPALHDAVTLQHFAVAGRLDVLDNCHGHLPMPRWTDTVHDEVEAGHHRGYAHCGPVLQCGWLGTPVQPSASDLRKITRIHIGLNEGRPESDSHLGEAESIYFAEKTGGLFVTDDNGAYDFAQRRPGLGPARVRDTVYVLRDAVANGYITRGDAAACAATIRAAGRHLLRTHPATLTASDF